MVICFGILHRVENPLGLLRGLGRLLLPGGRLLMETYVSPATGALPSAPSKRPAPGEVYSGDDYVYWGFGVGGLSALATWRASRVTIEATPTIDGHPRILASLERPGA